MHKTLLAYVFAVGALFAGFSLLTHILSGASLVAMLLTTFIVFVLSVVLTWSFAMPNDRKDVANRVVIGACAGIVSSAIYDVAKHLFSIWDSERYFPFVANKMFGQLLLGPEYTQSQWLYAGMGFHFLVGTCFGITFCLMFFRYGVIGGILWGIFLELFQVVLYPDWLGIKFIREFYQFSFIAHIIFGTSLALLCRFGLRIRGLIIQ